MTTRDQRRANVVSIQGCQSQAHILLYAVLLLFIIVQEDHHRPRKDRRRDITFRIFNIVLELGSVTARMSVLGPQQTYFERSFGLTADQISRYIQQQSYD